MFPNGLTFEPARTPDGSRQIWKISGDADFAALTEGGLVSFGSRPQRDSNLDPGSPLDEGKQRLCTISSGYPVARSRFIPADPC